MKNMIIIIEALTAAEKRRINNELKRVAEFEARNKAGTNIDTPNQVGTKLYDEHVIRTYKDKVLADETKKKSDKYEPDRDKSLFHKLRSNYTKNMSDVYSRRADKSMEIMNQRLKDNNYNKPYTFDEKTKDVIKNKIIPKVKETIETKVIPTAKNIGYTALTNAQKFGIATSRAASGLKDFTKSKIYNYIQKSKP